MGWKPNFKLLNQNLSNTYQNRQNHKLIPYISVKKIKFVFKKLRAKRWKIKSYKAYLCINFSPMIQQQQIHPLLP